MQQMEQLSNEKKEVNLPILSRLEYVYASHHSSVKIHRSIDITHRHFSKANNGENRQNFF